MARSVRTKSLVETIELKLWRNAVAANMVGVVVLAVDSVAFARMIDARPLGRIMGLILAAAVPYFVVAALAARPYIRRRLRPATRWIENSRTPTAAERTALAAQPRRVALYSIANWASLELWPIPYLYFVVGFRPGTLASAKIALAFAFAGLISATLTYMVVERTLRPLYALAGSEPATVRPMTLGMFPRILTAFVIVSGLPLIAIVVALVGLDETQREASLPAVAVIALMGILSGLVVAAYLARAISDPLKRVREGLGQVEGGSFAAELAVDEPGELGMLQEGFNRMVAGLRERERVRELFERHVGGEVAERAMSGDAGLGGELRDATAMFVDIVGSSRLAQIARPDFVVEFLNSFFDTVVRTVSAEGGMVNKFEGDGALCIFGAPADQPDHAERALRAARTLQQKLASMPDLRAAIGISSGEVVAGNVGAMDRYEYTIVGDAANEASRLCEHAKGVPGRVLASKTTIDRSCAEASRWKAAGTTPLRGRSEATLAFSPAGFGSADHPSGSSTRPATG